MRQAAVYAGVAGRDWPTAAVLQWTYACAPILASVTAHRRPGRQPGPADAAWKLMPPMTDPRALAATYLTSWKNRDFDTLRSVLAQDATFRGPLGSADNADDCVAGLRRMSEILTDIVVRKTLADDTDVITWFELHTTVAPPCPVANWSHAEDGAITAIRVTFDPRPLRTADAAGGGDS